MAINAPGLDLHVSETRWAELEEDLTEDPASALVEACDAIEDLITVDDGQNELVAAYAAARDVADRLEQGESVDPGDLATAIENLRAIRAALTAGDPT
jgi:predicted DNA-binding transcriptional regulator YafY